MLLNSSSINNRWTAQCKPGQTVSCRIINKKADGYVVSFGQNNSTGFLPTNEFIPIGDQVLLRFVGYKNQCNTFSTVYNFRATDLKPQF